MTDAVPIYIDIETVPGQAPWIMQSLIDGAEKEKKEILAPANYKDPVKISEFIKAKCEEIDADIEDRFRKTSLDGSRGQIVCLSAAVGDADPVTFWYDEWKDAEFMILEGLNQIIKDAYVEGKMIRPIFVGHNIAGFDLRFLYQRYVINQITPHHIIPFDAKPWDNRIYVTMAQWAGHGNRISLDRLCRCLGIDGKGPDIDGSKVWDFVQANRIAEVAAYCTEDVLKTRKVHRRMTFGRN